MTTPLLIADIAVYLQESGWGRSGSWRGAAVWARGDDQVLLPTRDDLEDNPARVRELLRTLAAVEARPARDIARDIAFPHVDSATYRLFPDEPPSGFTGLQSGLHAVSGLRDMLTAAARVALEGPHFLFSGRVSPTIGELLGRVKVGPGGTEHVSFTLLVPFSGSSDVTADALTGREVMTHLHDAASAVEEATRAGGIDAFDDTVTAGVSADFCAALSDLGGRRRREPFEVGFRWSPGLGSELPPRTVSFPPDAGALIRAASSRLRRLGLSIERSGRPQHLQRVVDLAPMEVARRASLDASGAAALVGRVESLHDDSGGTDRWRVRVRGELRTDRATGSRRAVWVRLDGQTAYDLAIEAHRAGQLVRAEGVLSNHTGRVELTAAPGRFAIDGTNP